MNSNLGFFLYLLLYALILFGIEFFLVEMISHFTNYQIPLSTFIKIAGMMFLVNFLALMMVTFVQSIEPEKAFFTYALAMLLKMIFVLILIVKFPDFKTHILLLMFNYFLYLSLTIIFLKSRILRSKF